MDGIAELFDSAMASLADKRPVFHSESDFQLALAWEIQTLHPDADLRLEKRVADKPRIELDLLVRLSGRSLGIELKYPRSKLEVEIGGELFVLATGAPDLERYDALKDVARLERLVSEGVIDEGCLILLTNAPRIWSPAATPSPTVYDDFRLHEGREVAGTLDWGPTTGEGTKIGRTEPVTLNGRYTLTWRDFSQSGPATFRYLLVPVIA